MLYLSYSYLTEPSHLKSLCMWIFFWLLICKSYIHLKVALKGDYSYNLNIFSRALWVHFLPWDDDCDSVIESVTTQLAMVDHLCCHYCKGGAWNRYIIVV